MFKIYTNFQNRHSNYVFLLFYLVKILNNTKPFYRIGAIRYLCCKFKIVYSINNYILSLRRFRTEHTVDFLINIINKSINHRNHQ